MSKFTGWKKPNYSNNNNNSHIKHGHKAWEDDEESPKIEVKKKTSNSNNFSNFSGPNIISTNQISSETYNSVNSNTYNNNNSYNNYNNNLTQNNYKNPMIVTQPTYDYEKRIIEEVLETSGISLKPSDGQLKEFNKKIKNLNKDVIVGILKDKINNSNNDVKIITKVLWVIDSVVKDKNNLEGYWNYYKQNEKVFEDMFYLNLGKKVNELSAGIYFNLSGIKLNSSNNNNNSNNVVKNVDLLNTDDDNNNNNNNDNNNVNNNNDNNNNSDPFAFFNNQNQMH